MKKIYMYTDGSSLGNPGFGGYCALLKYQGKEKIIKGAFKDVTNNQMELLAVIEGLKALKSPCEVALFSDSNYVVQAIESWLKGWIKKDFAKIKNPDLWREYVRVSSIHKVKATWVKAHAGHEENEICDTVARTAAEELKNAN